MSDRIVVRLICAAVSLLVAGAAPCTARDATSVNAEPAHAAASDHKASPARDLAIEWWTVDGGGGTSSGGPFVLEATVAQPDTAGPSGGSWVLDGGYWSPFAPIPIFVDGFESGDTSAWS